MIVGVGNDIVDTRRMQRVVRRHPQRFPRYILTAAEQQFLPAEALRLNFLAGRWAAKEALGKAIGCGLRSPLTFSQIAVDYNARGRPCFVFTAAAADFIRRQGVAHCHLSISHDGDYTCAVVIAEGAMP